MRFRRWSLKHTKAVVIVQLGVGVGVRVVPTSSSHHRGNNSGQLCDQIKITLLCSTSALRVGCGLSAEGNNREHWEGVTGFTKHTGGSDRLQSFLFFSVVDLLNNKIQLIIFNQFSKEVKKLTN